MLGVWCGISVLGVCHCGRRSVLGVCEVWWCGRKVC